MPDMLADGTIKVTFAPTIAAPAAPTTAELNAGTSLEAVITPDGLDTPGSTANVDTSSLASTQDSQGVGRRTFGPIVLTIKTQGQKTTTDSVRAALTYRSNGFLVIRRGISSATAWATTQEVEVYPVGIAQQVPVKTAPNELIRYSVELKVTSDAYPNAVVS